jgi:ABC-type transporter Mla subunit MlaD
MSERRQDVLVGLFVLIGLSALAGLIIWFGEAPEWLGGKTYDVKILFRGALSEVQEGTPLVLRGIPIGRVATLQFIDPARPEDGTHVIAAIDQKYVIPRASTARVRPAAIGFGRTDIVIELPEVPTGGNEPTDGSAEIAGKMGSPLDAFFDERVIMTLETTSKRIGDLAEQLKPVAQDLHEILKLRPVSEVEAAAGTENPIPPNLYSAVDRLYRVLTHFDQVLGDPATQSNVKVAIENLRLASEEARAAVQDVRDFTARGREFGDRISETLDTAQAQLQTVGEKLARNSDQLASVLDNVDKATRDMAEGEGTLGLILRDPKLYDEMVLTVRQLQEAIKDLQALLKKYEEKGLLG